MCKACNTVPEFEYKRYVGWGATSYVRDIKTACREATRSGPTRWQAPPRSVKAELTYQLRRLEANRQHEMEETEVFA